MIIKNKTKYKEKTNLIAGLAEPDTDFSVLLSILLSLRDDFCFFNFKER